MRRYVERDLWCYRLEVCTEVGCLHRPHALAIQWRIVEQLFRKRQRRYYGGIALQVLKSRGRDDRSPLSCPRKWGRYAHRDAQVALWHYGDKPVRSLDLGEDVNDMVALLDLAATVSPFCPRPVFASVRFRH
jgi:hypothetical protein